MKIKDEKLDYIQAKSFYASVDRSEKTAYRMAENICKAYLIRSFVSRIYKEFLQLSNKINY